MPKFISILFLLSGITGLVYEVVWAKYISLFLGNTGQAHTVVLATFMGGLALGNALLGRFADRVRSPLRFYGWLEMGIGILAATSPTLLSLLTDAYIYLARAGIIHPFATIPRLILSMSVLLLPAMLMGGTLPALSRLATRSLNQMERTVSWFYALNSAGAVLGALLAGFYLIPALGLGLSIVAIATLNILIGIVAIYFCGRELYTETLPAMEVSDLPEYPAQAPLRTL